MKTLVIHPMDYSTLTLCHVYETHNFTVIRDSTIDNTTLRDVIGSHDRIILLGHGLPNGLINPQIKYGRQMHRPFLVNSSHVDLLRTKEVISVWCYSDEFFRKYNIPGFHTGMIISEVNEAYSILG